MTRTSIDLDDDIVTRVMEKYGLKTKKAAVDYALHRAAGLPLTKEFLLNLEGFGWEGDLDEMRSDRVQKR